VSEPRQVLVVEDEPAIAIAIADALESAGYVVVVHESTTAAEGYLDRGQPAVVVLDRMLPDGDGLDWLADRRRRGWQVPCLVLSAKASEEERVAGLEKGADDYLGKPFGARELVARVDALLRRAGNSTSNRFRVGRTEVDLDSRTAGGKQLTEREWLVLTYLGARRGKIVSREELLRAVWDYREGTAAPTRAVDMCIVGLRRKLGDAADHLATIRGGGYMLRTD